MIGFTYRKSKGEIMDKEMKKGFDFYMGPNDCIYVSGTVFIEPADNMITDYEYEVYLCNELIDAEEYFNQNIIMKIEETLKQGAMYE